MTTLRPMAQDDDALRIRLKLADMPITAAHDDLIAFLEAHHASLHRSSAATTR